MEGNRCPLLSYVQSKKDLFLKVAKVIKFKDIVFDWFNQNLKSTSKVTSLVDLRGYFSYWTAGRSMI